MKTVLVSLVCALGIAAVWGQSATSTDTVLPKKTGLYAVDASVHPETQTRLRASEVRFNRHTGSNLAKNAFYLNSKATLDLEGNSAETGLPNGKITFLVPADSESPELALSRLTLVHLQTNADKRVLAALTANAFGGSPGRRLDSVDVAKETLSGGEWVRVTPVHDLAPGEYAIAYFPQDPRMFPDSAFDFRIEK